MTDYGVSVPIFALSRFCLEKLTQITCCSLSSSLSMTLHAVLRDSCIHYTSRPASRCVYRI